MYRSNIGRFFAALLLVVAGAAAWQLAGGTRAALADPAVTVSPSAAGPYDTFTVNGKGFASGSKIDASFLDSNNYKTNLRDSSGNNVSITAGGDGSFTLSLQPGVAFSSGSVATYHVTFCDSAGACSTADVNVQTGGASGGDGGGMGGGY